MAESQLIGQGTYGCVYKPNVPCLNENQTNKPGKQIYISKIQKTTASTDREEAFGKIIKEKIKRYNTMFSPILSSCPVNIGAISKSELEKCEVFTKHAERDTEMETMISKIEYKSYKMKYAGKDSLGKYFLSLLHKTPKKIIKRIFETHIYLLKSLDKLIKLDKPIIHYDLKDNNIIYNEDLDVPIIIDFGLSFELTPEKKYEHAIAYEQYFYFYETYPPWCIEMVLLSYIVQKIVDQQQQDITSKIEEPNIVELKTICTNFITENDIFKYCIAPEESEIMKQGLHQFVSSYLGKSWETMFQDLQKSYATWDHYSIAVIFLLYFKDMFTNITSPIITDYKSVLKTIILSVPSTTHERLSIDKTIQIFKKMAGSVDKKQYQKLLVDINTSINPETLNNINININKQTLNNQRPVLGDGLGIGLVPVPVK